MDLYTKAMLGYVKFDNFKIVRKSQSGLLATVNATYRTGFLWLTKCTEQVKVFKPVRSEFWRFMDNGKYTPITSMENLYIKWKFEKSMECDEGEE